MGMLGFHFQGGGGGVNRAPKNWGGGFGKRAQLTGTINQSVIMKSGAKGAKIFFEH